MIQLHDFSIGYNGQLLLENVNAEIAGGHLTALIGRNGSGKSTLLRALAGLNTDYSGEIIINGRPLGSVSSWQLARTIAFVSTERVRISNLRCEDVVAMGRAPYTNWIGRLQETDHKIVHDSLAAVGMTDYASRTMDRMSDGECQRIMIARALAQDTPVILLDEPTSFLDLTNRYELCALLANLAHDSKKCILFSTHELHTAIDLCDNLAIINSPQLFYTPAKSAETASLLHRLFPHF